MAKRKMRAKTGKTTGKKAAKKLPKKLVKAAARKPKRAAAKRAAPKREAAPPPAPRGGVVHWEIHARDQSLQQRFYRELFGWKIDDANPMGYGVVSSAGEGAIGGGFGRAQGEGGAAGVMFYVGVPSIEETLAKVTALGAQPIMPRTDLGMVIMAQFRDLEGNLIGLVEG